MEVVRGLSIFCDDIREEKSGQDALVGVMADNLLVPLVPVMVARLAIYTRVYFKISADPEPIAMLIQVPQRGGVVIGEASLSVVEGSLAEAKSKGNELAGVVLRAVLVPFPVEAAGPIEAMVKSGEFEQVLGRLNIIIDPVATASLPA